MTSKTITKEEVKRFPVYQYIKSKKLAAIALDRRSEKYTVLELSPNLSALSNVKHLQRVNHHLTKSTKYTLEAIEFYYKQDREFYYTRYKYLRILTDEDTNLNRWMNTESLDALPVSPNPDITTEERVWAGEREGNLVEGGIRVFSILATVLLFTYFAYQDINGSFLLIFFIALILWTKEFDWERPKKAQEVKLNELAVFKQKLRDKNASSYKEAKTNFIDSLKEYRTWEMLSPKDFEYALKYLLEDTEGYQLAVTKYSGDGGIDLQGKNQQGEQVLIQAKKFNSNVGVNVVREMIGVREAHPSKPHTIVFSLIDFTKGAKELAQSNNITLRTIRDEVLLL